MLPLRSTTTAGGSPTGNCSGPNVSTSSPAMVVAAGELSPSWMEVSMRLPPTMRPPRPWSPSRGTAPVWTPKSSGHQSPPWALRPWPEGPPVSFPLPPPARRWATLVNEDGADETGVDAMTLKDVSKKARKRNAKRPTSGEASARQYMLVLTCAYVVHHKSQPHKRALRGPQTQVFDPQKENP